MKELISKYKQEIKELTKSRDSEQDKIDSDDVNCYHESEEYISYCNGMIKQLTQSITDLEELCNGV